MQETWETGSIPGLGRSPGGGHGNPLQYSCLENPMDRGAWWASPWGRKELNMTFHNLKRWPMRTKSDILLVICLFFLFILFFNWLSLGDLNNFRVPFWYNCIFSVSLHIVFLVIILLRDCAAGKPLGMRKKLVGPGLRMPLHRGQGDWGLHCGCSCGWL